MFRGLLPLVILLPMKGRAWGVLRRRPRATPKINQMLCRFIGKANVDREQSCSYNNDILSWVDVQA